MPKTHFTITHRDSKTKARVGAWQLSHGTVQTPLFMPDATRAVMRGLDNRDITEAHIPMAVINTLHLALSPGVEYFRKIGGIHALMNTELPLLSDSGGFQVMSLARKYPHSKITDEGFQFKDPTNGRHYLLTPEESITMQHALGTDAMVVLDRAAGPGDLPEQIADGIRQTTAWAQQSLHFFDKMMHKVPNRPALFGVIQGGDDPAKRKESYEGIQSDLFTGYGWGGWPVDDQGQLNLPISQYLADLIPDHQMRYGMGIGTPEDIVNLVEMGFDLFDTVLPTRDARHGRLYVPQGFLYIKKKMYRDDTAPIEPGCDCYTCTHFTRRYLHHLYSVQDTLYARLGTIHNLRFYSRLMEEIRQAIQEDRFAEFKKAFTWTKTTVE